MRHIDSCFVDGLYGSWPPCACRKSDRESKLLTTSLKSTGQNKFAIEEKEVCLFAHVQYSVFTLTFTIAVGFRLFALGDL